MLQECAAELILRKITCTVQWHIEQAVETFAPHVSELASSLNVFPLPAHRKDHRSTRGEKKVASQMGDGFGWRFNLFNEALSIYA